MIDIHCHPLPSTDDGAKSPEIAAEMCKMAAADGITHLVATPHSNYQYPFDAQVNRTKLAELQAAAGPKPQLLLGCDFHLSFENLDRLREHRGDYTINGTDYLLVEFADFFIPDQMDQVFYEIEIAGITPILTHPERNPAFIQKPELLHRWTTRGCLAQITAMSFTGRFGRTAQRLADHWLNQNLVHFFASDAHDLKHRPPVLSECYARLSKLKGKEIADLLMVENPEAVINGRPLPPQADPGESAEPPRRRKWFSFLTHS